MSLDAGWITSDRERSTSTTWSAHTTAYPSKDTLVTMTLNTTSTAITTTTTTTATTTATTITRGAQKPKLQPHPQPEPRHRCDCAERSEDKCKDYGRKLHKGIDKAYIETSHMVTEDLKKSIEGIIAGKMGTRYLYADERHGAIAPALLPATLLLDGSVGLLDESFMIVLSMLGRPLVPYAPAVEIFFSVVYGDEALRDLTGAILQLQQQQKQQQRGLAVVVQMPGKRYFAPPTSVFLPTAGGELVLRRLADGGGGSGGCGGGAAAWSEWMEDVHDIGRTAAAIAKIAAEEYNGGSDERSDDDNDGGGGSDGEIRGDDDDDDSSGRSTYDGDDESDYESFQESGYESGGSQMIN
ncbi:hypothetical protein F5X99DRAFT_429112 [Biscogniauxia marginata]|nr:hypothetical protein F5X99DRAFT_429112 [Biscogniauxia marginata]